MKKLIAVFLALLVLLGAGYVFLNIQYNNDREEVLAYLAQGDVQAASDAIGNVFFFRMKDEKLCETVATARAFVNAENGEASFYFLAQDAAAGYEPAETILEHLKPVAYERAVGMMASEDTRHDAKNFFESLGDYKNSGDYLFVCEIWENSRHTFAVDDEDMERLVTLMELETVPQLLVYHNATALIYLKGIWLQEGGVMGFVLDGDYVASYDLPFDDVPDGTFAVIDGVFTILDTSEEPIGELFRFEPIDGTHMNVYCYADGSTYSMEKILDY